MMIEILLIIFASYNWVHYTNSGDIRDFCVKDSILYAGTNGGLVEVSMEKDSVIQKYTGAEGLLQNEIRDLEFSPHGGIWIAYQDKGLAYFKDGQIWNYEFGQISSTSISDIFFYNNYLILCDKNSLKVVSTKGTENIEDDFILFERLPEWSYGDLIKHVAIFRDTIFLGTSHIVYFQSFDKFIAGLSPDTFLQVNNLSQIKPLGDSLFILTGHGFWIYPSLHNYMGWAYIFDIVKTDTVYFVGTHWGVYRWKPGTNETQIDPSFTNKVGRISVYKNKIFAGCIGDRGAGKGIYVYDVNVGFFVKIKKFIREIAGNYISTISLYKNGFVCGMRNISPYKAVSIVLPDKLPIDTLHAWARGVTVIGDLIFVGRFGGATGMFIIDSSGGIIDTLFKNYVFHTLHNVGDSLIIASSPGMEGFIIYNYKDEKVLEKVFQEYINDLEWDNGVIWAVTGPSTKVFKIDLGNNIMDPLDDEVFIYQPSRSMSAVDIEVDRDYLYIASTNGLYIYKKNPFMEYLNLNRLLPDTFCLGVERDKKGDLWVLTTKALVRILYGYEKSEFYFSGPHSIMEVTFPGENPQYVMGSELLKIDEENSRIICGTMRGIAVLELGRDYYYTPLDSALVYPNPCRKELNKYLHIKTLSDIDEITIFDLKGKKLKLEFERFDKGYRIKSEKFKPGIYILRIKKGKNVKIIKFSIL